jgi:ubiquinone/menaquinone biosynthesis C-methylase UbiE
MPEAPFKPVEAEKTFRSYNSKQGANYASYRPNYHTSVYESLIDYHKSTGGQLDTVLDVGCGTGMAIRNLGPLFTHAIGLDASEGMLDTARSLGGTSSTSEPIRFELSTAEELGSQLSSPIKDGSVDLITAAAAAHWFDMPAFWARAAKVLKPGGSVAMWTSSSIRVHPDLPNAAAIQVVLDKLENEDLDEYTVLGNRLVRGVYHDLPLPWTVATPIPEFNKELFLRKEWNTGAVFNPDEWFFENQRPISLDAWEMVLGTSSPVTRWREAHPEAVGTEEDVVRKSRREFERLLREAGVEKGKEMVEGSVKGVLLVVKKNI